MTPNDILRQAREGLGKEPFEVAHQASVTAACYSDMESYPDELYSAVSLADLQRVAVAVGLTFEQLFGGEAILLRRRGGSVRREKSFILSQHGGREPRD